MRNTGKPNQARRLQAIDAYLAHSPLRLGRTAKGTVAAWFLGPKGENQKLLSDLVIEAIRRHCKSRRAFHPEDPIYITRDVKKKESYQQEVKNLRERARELYGELQLSAPISSMRHQGHMLWDQVLPGMVGYFAAMLYNQNNVAAEASPVTTGLEIEVGNDLCRMLGFDAPVSRRKPAVGDIVPWGHITCDGSVANIEGLWAARNAKFLAIALQAALREVPVLAPARRLKVRLLDRSSAPLLDLDPWVLLNLKIDDVVGLPYQIESRYGIKTEIIAQVLSSYSVQSIGMFEFYRRFLPGFPAAVAIVPSTRHYSWPKAGALLGIGQNNILKIYVDLQARMDIGNLADVLRG